MKNIFKRTLAMMLVLCMLLVGFAGCKDDDGPIDPEQAIKDAENILASKEYRDTYKTYFSTSYSSLNYFSTSYATVREIVTNCIDGLVEPDIYGNYVGSMAESWEHNEDYTVWTFKIRQGLKWIDHTGAETEYALTAQDFVDGIRYIGDPLNGAYSLPVVRNLIKGLYDYYWGLDDIDCGVDTTTNRADLEARFSEIVGVKAIDDYTVEYTLESGAPYFLSLIESSMLLLPIEYDYAMALGEDFGVDNTKMLYCGAYYVSEFKRDKLIKLSANAKYWDAANVNIKTVEYQMIPDGTTSLEMFQRGELDYTSVESEAYQSLQSGEWGDKILELFDVIDEYIPDPERETDKPFLMPVEDVFTITGRGTVATGRVERGVLHLNDEVEIVGVKEENRKTVVTGIEMFRKLLDEAQAGDNIGALLRGIQRTDIVRGQVLCKPGSVQCHKKFTAQVYVLTKDEGGRHTPFFNNYRPQFYFRTTDVTGVCELPAGTEMCMPGDNVEMTIELIHPVAMEQGLTFAIREGGRTVGSGRVATIVE